MDKSHTDFLAEIRAELERLKKAVAALEEKLSACEAEAAVEAEVAAEVDIEMPEVDSAQAAVPEVKFEAAAEVDIEMPEVDSAEAAVPEVKFETAAEAADFTDFEIGAVEDLEDLPEASASEASAPAGSASVDRGMVIPEPEAIPEPESVPSVPENGTQDTKTAENVPYVPENGTQDTPTPTAAAQPAGSAIVGQETAVPAPKPKAKPALEGNYPWQQARPGVSVKHIRSGISLLDRAQFITILFKEDYALYDSTLAALEGMESLDDAVTYLMEQFPQWNYKSDIVFSFMMAVRKKLG